MHYDRLIVQLLLLAVVVFMVIWGIAQCSRNNNGAEYNREVIIEAVEAARRDAAKVLDTAPGSMQRDEALLSIKATESKLRQSGYGHAADDYIGTVREILEENGIR